MRLSREATREHDKPLATDCSLNKGFGGRRTVPAFILGEGAEGRPAYLRILARLPLPLWLTSLLVLMYQWRGEKPFVFSRAASHLGPDAAALFPELFPSGLAVLNLAVPRLIMCSEPLL